MKIRDIIETTTEQEINRELRNLRRKFTNEIKLYEAAAIPSTPPSFFRSAAASKFVTFLKKGAAGVTLALIAEPIYDYITNMNAAWKNYHDHGGSVEEYNEIHMNKAGMLVTALAVNLGALMASGIASSIFISFISFIPIIGPILARILSIVNVGTRAYILTRLNSQEGQLAIANAITGTVIRDTGKFAVAAIDWIHETVADALHLDKSTITPTRNSGSAASTPPAETPQPKSNYEQDTPSPRASDELLSPLHANPGGYVPMGRSRDAQGRLQV